MKKAFRLIALAMAVIMLAGTLCGCSAFVEGFIEGYNSAMNENSGSSDDDYDEDYIFSFDNSNDEEEDDDFVVNGGDDEGGDTYDSSSSNAQYAKELFESNAGTYTAADILGKWVDYEDDTITFYADGTLDYYGTTVDKFDFDGQFLYLTYNGESEKWLARLYGDKFVIYSDPYYYGRTEGTSGLVGSWESTDGNDYSFEFTEDGTFVEDGVDSGEYFIEGNDIILLYDDGEYITYGIFVVDGDKLGFAYGLSYDPVN